MRSSRVLVIVGVVVAVVIALIGWRSCGSSSKTSSASTTGSATQSGVSVDKRVVTPRGPMKPATLSGRVIKKTDGTGIPGAVVSLARAELIAQIMPSAVPTVVVVTDAQGAWTATPVVPGNYFVAATANGFLPLARAKLFVDSGENKRGVDLALEAGGILVSGTVSDVLGGPISDARITIKRDDVFDLSGAPEYMALTKLDGTYALTLPEGDYEARATHDDYTSSRHGLEILTDPVKLDFVLTPGGVIRGQVVARDTGKPVPGAFLLAESGGRRGGGGENTTRADDGGNFVLRGLQPGAVSLRAQGPGYSSTAPTIVELGVGEQADNIRVLVDQAFSISGTVVRKGKPTEGIPGVQLGVFSIGTQQYGLSLEPTDQTGAFVIHGVRPASYMLGAGGEGNVPEIGTSVEVVDKDVTGVIVEMSAGVTLSGRVEPPLAKTRIALELSGPVGITNMFEMMKSAFLHAETDATGAFTLEHAPAGGFTIKAVAPSGDTGELPLVIGEVDQTGLVVKLETRASISGRVVDDKGAAVSEARVSADSLGEDSAMSFSMGGRDNSSGTTRRDGSFKIVGLDAGSYQLRVRDTDRGASLKLKDRKSGKVELAKAQQLTSLTLTVESRDGVIRGQVIGTDRKPIADAWVTASLPRPDFKKITTRDSKPDEAEMEQLREWEPDSKPVLTNAEGRFVIGKLRQGTYKLVAEGPRGISHGELAEAKTGTSVTITLVSLGTLTGKVTVDGAPVAAYDINCDGAGDNGESDNIKAADGAYKLDRMVPGKYECAVDAAEGFAKKDVEVPSGDAKLDLALERWGVITGKVVDVLTKKPVQNVLIMPTSEGSSGAKMFESMLTGKGPKPDANGVFTVQRVASGTGVITIMQPDMMMSGQSLAMKHYTIKAGERLDLGTIEVVAPRTGDAGTFGFSTTVADGKLMVATVKPDGPAAAAGVKEGDQIVALNGTPVATLTADVAQKLLSSGIVGVGTPVALTIDRAGSPVQTTVVSVKW